MAKRKIDPLCDDLLVAASFMANPGSSLDESEAIRIALVLAETAGELRAADGWGRK